MHLASATMAHPLREDADGVIRVGASRVTLQTVVAAYDLGEALANLLQPFWMLPVLGVFGLRARDVMGYTFIVALVLAPVVLLLVTLLGATLPYPL